MNLDTISELCNELNGVTSDIKWEDHLCFNVGGKMFFIASLEHIPTSASFKIDEAGFNELTEQEGVIPAPYLARYKWVKVDNIERFSKKEWKKHIETSYFLVVSKLSKKLQKELGILK